jgi:hypothetical protein
MGQAREVAGRSWAEFHAPIGRFIPLNPRDGAELAFPAEYRGGAGVWYGFLIRTRAASAMGHPKKFQERGEKTVSGVRT